ncbi:pimeloyl-ACP methyl ester carboxylesterase [Pedobacter cryoconitis]|uniref:alpha/beta fold hydrolase n=1 Tax=Pedobacter cryoconitis TaxID=188932 RepID=UPI0016089CB4|nr:alpha/beta hydrolase [Pedobacter cryoconitis]MBB6271915.1 pimeloyl-ACP methyl ester carboxylesterase [Pedobacter cryoconitis]
MKRATILFFLFVLTCMKLFAQNKFLANKTYLDHNQRAIRYKDQKQYLQSGLSYDSLFKAHQGNGVTRDKYIAACSWALANNSDKAFYYLTQYINETQTFLLDFLYEDQDLKSLHQDRRWEPLTSLSKLNIQKAKEKYKPQDTLVDVGTHKLFFNIIKGSSTVILFETGGMDNSTVWSELLIPIYDATGATLITYDRAGYGKSTRDSVNSDITNEIKGLELALSKLSYASANKILVCHSLGGFYADIYSSRNPSKVKAAVFIDASLGSFYTDQAIKRVLTDPNGPLEQIRKDNISIYYIAVDLHQNAATVRATPFPAHIPITDIYAETPPWEHEIDNKGWKDGHKNFIKARPNSKIILAEGCTHYVAVDNPQLVLNEIIKSYQTVVKAQ